MNQILGPAETRRRTIRRNVTTHFVGFVVGKVDWCAHVEISGLGEDACWEVTYVEADMGRGHAGVVLEDDDLTAHGAMVDGSWKTFLQVAEATVERKLGDLLDDHEQEARDRIADERAEQRREDRIADQLFEQVPE